MTAQELKEIIARGETLCVEFKSDKQKLSDRDLVEAVVAMANTDGGLLLAGVEDNGTVTGLHKTHRGCGTPTALIANRTTPSLHVTVHEVCIDGHPIFAIEVPRANGIVGTTDGYYAHRKLKADGCPEAVPMGPFEIQQRLSSLQLIDPSEQLMPEIPLSAIDPLQRERMRAAIRNNNHADKVLLELEDSAFDLALRLVKKTGGKPCLTLAGALFLTSADVLREHVPTHEVAFQALQSTRVAVNEHTRLPLVEAFDALLIQFKARLEETEDMNDLFRNGVPNYDIDAFREALVNALVHRDFSRIGTVIVKFDDAGLTISNPGGLVDGVTLANLLTVQPTPRNPLLAEIAKRIGLAERTGRGIDRIFAGSLRYGRPRPDYSATTSSSVVVFLADAKPDLAFLSMLNKEELETGKSLPFDSLVVLAALRESRRLGLAELSRLVQKPAETVRPVVEELLERGFLERHREGNRLQYSLAAGVYHATGMDLEYVRTSGFTEIEQEQMVLKLIDQKGFVSRRHVMKLFRISKSPAFAILSRLRDKDEIVMQGNRKSARYVRPPHAPA